MGHRFEVYCKNTDTAKQVINSAVEFGVGAKVIGRCEPYHGKKLTIIPNGEMYLEY